MKERAHFLHLACTHATLNARASFMRLFRRKLNLNDFRYVGQLLPAIWTFTIKRPYDLVGSFQVFPFVKNSAALSTFHQKRHNLTAENRTVADYLWVGTQVNS